jgi:hypothetical protein
MSIDEANLIWNACYGDDLDSDGWTRYTSAQRLLAIDIRQLEHERLTGGWGNWHISDRH